MPADEIVPLQPICGAANAQGALLENVGVDHGGAELAVTEEILHGSAVGTVLEQVRGEGMAGCGTWRAW